MNLAILTPIAAILGLSLPLLVVLHMRHARTKPLPITTMRFWAEATKHRRQRLAWRRPPRTLLLLLQLLAAALIVLAVVRPAIPFPSLPGSSPPRQLIVVLDNSASMRATDLAPSRFAVAQSRARELINGATAEESVALLTLGAEPQTFRSRDAGDRAVVLTALDNLVAGGGSADINGAVPALQAVLLPGRENRIELLSAGVFAAPPDQVALAALPAALHWEQIGQAVDNLAITTTAIRRSTQNSARTELFARVANYAQTATNVRSVIEADGQVVDNRTFPIAAGATTELVWPLPPGTRGARLKVESSDGQRDPLPFDNEAVIVTRDTSQRQMLLVSENPAELQRALAAQPGATVTTVTPASYQNDRQYDLVVFDRFVPATLPRGGILLVNPSTSNTLIPVTGTAEATPAIVRADRENDILRGVDLTGLTIPTTAVHTLPKWATEIVGSERGPLIMAGNTEGHEIVAITFDLTASGLTKKLAFPLLIGNIVDRLQTHRVPTTAQLGTSVLLEPVAGTSAVQLRDPAGAIHDLPLRETAGGLPTVYAPLNQPGLYALIQRDATGSTILQESFAVNGSDPIASNLRVVADRLPVGQGGIAPALTSGEERQPSTQTTQRRLSELGPLLLAIGGVFLVLEWLVGLSGLRPAQRVRERVQPRRGQFGPGSGAQWQ